MMDIGLQKTYPAYMKYRREIDAAIRALLAFGEEKNDIITYIKEQYQDIPNAYIEKIYEENLLFFV